MKDLSGGVSKAQVIVNLEGPVAKRRFKMNDEDSPEAVVGRKLVKKDEAGTGKDKKQEDEEDQEDEEVLKHLQNNRQHRSITLRQLQHDNQPQPVECCHHSNHELQPKTMIPVLISRIHHEHHLWLLQLLLLILKHLFPNLVLFLRVSHVVVI